MALTPKSITIKIDVDSAAVRVAVRQAVAQALRDAADDLNAIHSLDSYEQWLRDRALRIEITK